MTEAAARYLLRPSRPRKPYSGKWQLRAPKSLHRKLTERAGVKA